MTFDEFQRVGSNSYKSGKGEDAETREEQSRNNSAALGQGPVPPRGIYITVSLSSSAELTSPTNGRRELLDEASFIPGPPEPVLGPLNISFEE